VNTIRDYIEQIFKTVPLTKETLQLKTDMLANMEDKYLALKEEGASEHEAIGVVIAEFGNVDELLEEMGIGHSSSGDDLPSFQVMEQEDLSNYLMIKGKAGMNIGLGILSCLTGLGSLLLLRGQFNLRGIPLYAGLLFAIVLIALGVGLFIVEGMRLSDTTHYHKPFVLRDEDKNWLEENRQLYKRSYSFSIVAGVTLCILSFSPLFLSIILQSPRFSVLAGVGMMAIMAGLGVLFFVYSGNYWNAFTVLLSNGKPMETIHEDLMIHKRKERAQHIIEQIYWPIIVIAYFILSYVFNGWGWTWLIFVVGGLLEDVIENLFVNKRA